MRELSEKEYQSMQSHTSYKSEYQKKKGKEVSLDWFLFTCYDTSRQIKEIDHRYHEKSFWVGFDDPNELQQLPLDSAIKNMIRWYKSEFPVLGRGGSMDIDRMSLVARHLAYFEKDFKNLVRLKSGEYLEDHVLDRHELTPPWTYLKHELISAFNKTGEKIWTYFMWAYGISPPTDVVNISEIPPVNRFQQPYRNAHMQQQQQQPYRSRPRGGNHRGGGHHSGNHGGDVNGNTIYPPGQHTGHGFNKSSSGGGPSRGGGYGGGHRKKRSANTSERNFPHSHGRDSGKRGKPNSRHHGGNLDRAGGKGLNKHPTKNPNKIIDKAKEKKVLALVDQAIAKLEKQSQLNEISLAPQNSFYRRIQHQHAVERGYRSESTGSEKKRAVKLLRK